MIHFDNKLLYFIKLVLESDNVFLTFEESKLLNDKFDELISLIEKFNSIK